MTAIIIGLVQVFSFFGRAKKNLVRAIMSIIIAVILKSFSSEMKHLPNVVAARKRCNINLQESC